MNKDLAISVRNITKIYKLYKSPKDRLKEALNPFRKKYYKPFYALKDISFDVKKGEILGVVGKNGAGKSTLLEIITGVLSQTSGTVKTNGKISALLSLGIGFNPELTGIENIRFNGALQGYTKKELDLKIKDILDFAEIGDFAYQPIKTYSSGMSARLGFAVSINTDPDILIVDEALAVGDELFRRKCYANLERLMTLGKTILFVTHSVTTILQLCTNAVFIDEGELILEGSPKFVVSNYQKFLFTKKEDQIKIREEISALNEHRMEKRSDQSSSLIKDRDTQLVKSNINEIEHNKLTSYFLSGFESKSKSIVQNFDVKINNLKITCLDGKEVNHLVNSDEYYLVFNVCFYECIENFAFSLVFKNEKGSKLSGVRFPSKHEFIPIAKENDTFQIKVKFICTLLFGNYYLDIGVNHKNKDFNIQLVVLYKDILVFKVVSNKIESNAIYNWGSFSMGRDFLLKKGHINEKKNKI